MRWACLALLLLAGCGERRTPFTVASPRPPYVAQRFDPKGVASVDIRGGLAVFRLSGHEVTRREYFTHLQEKVGLKVVDYCMRYRNGEGPLRDGASQACEAIAFWESMKREGAK